MCKSCDNLNKSLSTRCYVAWVRKFLPKLHGKQRNWCWNYRGTAWFCLVLRIWSIFLFFANFLIHGFEFVSKLWDVEYCTIGGGGVTESCVWTLRGCANGSTLRGGAGVLVIFGGRIFLFWLHSKIGGNGSICKWGWDGIHWKMWLIWFIVFFVASP